MREIHKEMAERLTADDAVSFFLSIYYLRKILRISEMTMTAAALPGTATRTIPATRKKSPLVQDNYYGTKNYSNAEDFADDWEDDFEDYDDAYDYYEEVMGHYGRYWTSLAVTPSDHRTGENCAHQIIRNML